MIDKWNSETYGSKNACWQDHADLWGKIQMQVNNGWFVPSSKEWAAVPQTTRNYKIKL